MARLSGPAGRIEHTELLVDTGTTFLVIPQSLADRLAIVPTRHLPVLIAGGTRTKWPVGEIRIDIEESLLLTVDPIARRLVPTEGHVLSSSALATR
jgi:predicted aspartyl protease